MNGGDNGNTWATDVERKFLEDKKPDGREAKSKKSHKEFIATIAAEFSLLFPEGRRRALKRRGFRKQDMVTYLSDGDSPAREQRLPSDQIFQKVSAILRRTTSNLTFHIHSGHLQLVQ